MVKRCAVTSVAILLAWTAIDGLAHRVWLAPLYASNPDVWRPIADIDTALAAVATLVLIGVFVLLFEWLVQPKTLTTGVRLGGLVGVALGVASGLGTYIHIAIPGALALAWLVLGTFKSLVAGAILGIFARGAGTLSGRRP